MKPNNDFPMFCNVCGAKLIKNKISLDIYDMETGKNIQRIEIKCLNEKWYNIHASYTTDKTGTQMLWASWWDI